MGYNTYVILWILEHSFWGRALCGWDTVDGSDIGIRTDIKLIHTTI